MALTQQVREKIAASLGRISDESDDQGYSIDSQLRLNREYAAQHGIHIAYEFEEYFTGAKYDRPQLAKVLRLIRRRAINVLIVYATDRFARKIGVADLLLDELTDNGVELHIVQWNGPVQPHIPESRTRFLFESTFSDHERQKIIERTTRGRNEKVHQRGQLTFQGFDRYGFQRVGRKKEQHYIIAEQPVQVIKGLSEN